MDNTVIYEDAKKIIENVNLTELSGKKILITGATGLLGTYFLYTLNAFIHKANAFNTKVYIVTYHGLPEYLLELKDQPWLNIVCGDLTNGDVCDALPDVDYIIHAAGYGQPAKFVIEQDKTLKLNTYVLFKLFDKLNHNGKLLFVSSSGIYNGLNKDTFDETDVGTTNTFHPRACYIEGKRCGEAIVNAYRQKGIEAKSVRLSYTYGPGVRRDDQRALYSFIKKSFTGVINLLDDGSAQRIYCYISDVIEVMWKILLEGKEAIYNVGGKDSITIKELAEKIAKFNNSTISLPQISASVAGNAVVERLNINKILVEFDKKNFVTIDEGLDNTIKWFNSNYR